MFHHITSTLRFRRSVIAFVRNSFTHSQVATWGFKMWFTRRAMKDDAMVAEVCNLSYSIKLYLKRCIFLIKQKSFDLKLLNIFNLEIRTFDSLLIYFFPHEKFSTTKPMKVHQQIHNNLIRLFMQIHSVPNPILVIALYTLSDNELTEIKSNDLADFFSFLFRKLCRCF